MVTTRKTNANVHPGQVVLASQQNRHSKKQIQDDNAMASAEAHASQKKVAAEYHTVVQCIAELEDEMDIAEKDTWAHANRPDLCSGPPPPPQQKCTTSASGSHKPLQSEEGDDDSGSESASGKSEEGNPQSKEEDSIHTADFAGDDENGPDPACEDEYGENVGPIQLSDEECLIPPRHTAQKEVSPHFFGNIVIVTDWSHRKQNHRNQKGASLEQR